jgi:hypothetical protein
MTGCVGAKPRWSVRRSACGTSGQLARVPKRHLARSADGIEVEIGVEIAAAGLPGGTIGQWARSLTV